MSRWTKVNGVLVKKSKVSQVTPEKKPLLGGKRVKDPLQKVV